MGCAFDMYSSSYSDRAYGVVLLFLCWIFPLFVIFFSYLGIISHTRLSSKNLFSRTKSFRKHRREEENRESDRMGRENVRKREWEKKRKVIFG